MPKDYAYWKMMFQERAPPPKASRKEEINHCIGRLQNTERGQLQIQSNKREDQSAWHEIQPKQKSTNIISP
jgi:hypothetical protein